MTFKLKPIVAGVALALTANSAFAADSVQQQLQAQQELIKQQQAAIEQLSRQVKENQDAVEAAVEAVETGSGESAMDKVTVGGYGELHYNNLTGEGGASDKKSIDFHRFVLMFGYEFSDNVRFFSEVELEHSLSGDGKPGEVELEQAYIDWDFADNWTSRSGLFLLPVGLLNETHEPDTFYGVERNNVEKYILPTTWWEAGTGVIGRLDNGVTVQGFVHSGLETSADSKYSIRSGRQKVAKANAEDLAATIAVSYAGVPGLTVGGSFQYQGDLTQSADAEAGSAYMVEGHFDWQYDAFTLRGLYAMWTLDGNGPESIGADEQTGWYLEPSYKVTEKLGVFARYSTWDNQAGDSADSAKAQTDFGINYWLHPRVVFKADYQMQDNDNGKDQKGFNLGVGYSF
ncbi:porin [Ferrimonas sediminicola]|uniref:Porin n=1 Tax=Ferrimonas sediminicola TaxID=2569538 RepID=A0A4U1BE48_9GAMM|nr:porin [Ferrimonas sediminicola]TKB49413.1 porin [Ferrimonas sediminicola]